MSYLQRLLDAAPAGVRVPPSLTPAGGAPSPVAAADQRLDLFPGLDTAFGRSLDETEEGQPERRSLRHRPPQDTQARRRRNAPADDASSDRSAEARPTLERVAPRSDDPPSSAWQRIVEADPLPDPGTGSARPPQAGAEPLPEIRTESLAPAQVSEPLRESPTPPQNASDPQPATPRVQEQVMPAGPARPEPAMPGDSPWPIRVDAFRPIKAPEAHHADASARPPPLEPRSAIPAEPSEDAAPSPLSGVPEEPVPHGPAAPQATVAAAEQEVRVVERIREVAVDPAPPPRMTAVEASVIGPLATRQRGPRELMFGRS